MIAFIGMETSGVLRRALQAAGVETYSCDILPSEDDGEAGVPGLGRHIVGDVFEVLDGMWADGQWPDLAIFHPDCTYLTSSAEWAYKDGPYHQRVRSETLVGAARRAAREEALDTVRRILTLKIRHRAVENPIGAISRVRKFDQIIQPWQFGEDASKATGLILDGLPKLRPTGRVRGRLVEHRGKMIERWSNQTDGGFNRLAPIPTRWKDRARTYPGIAAAMAGQWLRYIRSPVGRGSFL